MSAGRKLAEWTTLALSVAIILAIAGALAYRALQPHDPYLVIESHALLDGVRRAGERWVVPVEVRNAGERTATRVGLEVSERGEGASAGAGEPHAVEIEYLGAGSRRRVYVYLDRPPGRTLQARVTHYSLE